MKECSLGIIWNEARTQVLLIKRRDVAVWVLPGGGIDAGETPESAALREVLEETGLHVAIQYKVAEYAPINSWTSRTHLYVCYSLSGSCKTGNETVAIQFFPLHALPPRLFDYHKEWLHEIAQTKHPFPLHKKMSRRTFWKIILKAFMHPYLACRYLCAKYGFPINS